MSSSAVRVALICALALTAGPGSGAAQARSDAPPEIRLRPGDGLRILIKDEPGLSGEFPVSEHGAVMLPLLGLVPVAGRPFDDVADSLRVAYAAELVEPELLITPLLRVAVLGEVRRPGLFPVDPTHTLGDVLATVGGLLPTGNPDRISLVRDGQVIVSRLDPGSRAWRVPIRSGDQIIVGRYGWFRENLAIFVGAAASVAAAAVTTLIVR